MLLVMAVKQGARKRRRGEVEELPSGALRVRVYAGVDPVTHKRHNLAETVPPGPKAAAEAEKVRTRLLATVHVGESMRRGYQGLVRNHIVPLLGEVPVGRVRGEVLDSF